jgi:serine/threonine-protein kinase HipA
MHLKNFSLIENSAGSRKYILSPAYDMLSTNVVIPADKEQLALPMNDKKQNIRKKDFLNFADVIGIPVKSAEKMLAKVYSMQDLYLNMTADSYLPETMKHSLSNLIINRFDVLNR